MRLFVAIEMPAPVRAALGELIDRLALAGEPVKWVDEANLHLTLKVLGEAPEERLPEIRAALDRAARGIAPFEARARGAGGYPSAKRPRIVWAGLEAPDALRQLAEQVERELEPLGFPRERRDWSAHVTVGRAREGHQRRRPRKGRAPAEAPGPLLSEAIAREAGFDAGTVRIEKVTLFRSQLQKTGPIYTAVYEAPLAG